jgi:hypothetical protein
MKYIKQGWDSYHKLVVPLDASSVQVSETKQAFYSGAAILFQALMLTLDPGDGTIEPTEEDMQRVSDLQAEIDEFGQMLDKKMFKIPEH